MPTYSFTYDKENIDFTASVVDDGFIRSNTAVEVDETILGEIGTGKYEVTRAEIISLFCKEEGKQGRDYDIGLDLKSKLTKPIVSDILLKKLNYVIQPDKWKDINIPRLEADKDTFWDLFFGYLEDILHDTDSMEIGDRLQFIFTFKTPTTEFANLPAGTTIKSSYKIDIQYTLIEDPGSVEKTSAASQSPAS